MKYLFGILLIVHGLIHVMGFAKAFNLSEIKSLRLSISKPLGILWALAFLLFTIVAFLFLSKSQMWWLAAFIAIGISQILIILYWKDAKAGTAANIIILAIALIGFGNWNFEKTFRQDVSDIFEEMNPSPTSSLRQAEIDHLPIPVQRYLKYTGVLNQPEVYNAHILMKGSMRSKVDDWFSFDSEQYNFFNNPNRLFFMKANVNRLPTNGYHAYKNGKALMQIKLLSLFPVININNGTIDKAETVTVFNDMCILAPASLIDDNIEWETIDDSSAKAIFHGPEHTITATLEFNESGQLINFLSDDRYDISRAGQYRFSTPITRYQKINNLNLPAYGEAIWHYPEGPFVYGKFEIKDIAYNVPNI